jgi:hypothetical protein
MIVLAFHFVFQLQSQPRLQLTKDTLFPNYNTCQVTGVLERIPVSALDTWTIKKNNVFFPPLGYYEYSNRLPLETYLEKNFNEFQKLQIKKKRPPLNVQDVAVRETFSKKTFFDFIVTSENHPTLVLSAQNELSVWVLQEDSLQPIHNHWVKQQVYELTANGFFTLFEYQKQLHLIDYDGTIYQLWGHQLQKKYQLPHRLKDILLLVDKDSDKIGYVIKNTMLPNDSLKDVFEKRCIFFSHKL